MLSVNYGTMIWMTIAFLALILILKKFAWKPILNAIKEREDSIESSLQTAERVKKEMQELQANNEKLMIETRAERDLLLKEARGTKNEIIKEAREKAKEEGDKMIQSAKEAIQNEKMLALSELKNEVGNLSIEIAEKLLQRELDTKNKQRDLVDKLLQDIKIQ